MYTNQRVLFWKIMSHRLDIFSDEDTSLATFAHKKKIPEHPIRDIQDLCQPSILDIQRIRKGTNGHALYFINLSRKSVIPMIV